MSGELLWVDLTNPFRPHIIRSWKKPMIYEWKYLLPKRGMYIKSGRARSKYESIFYEIYWDG